MQTRGIEADAPSGVWLNLALVGLAAVLLVSAVLDRRNGVMIETAGRAVAAETTPAPLTTDELIREMLTHD